MHHELTQSTFFASLPPEWPEDLSPAIRASFVQSRKKMIVLDDDPTGTQTVYDIPILTTWSIEELSHAFALEVNCFFILTNTRAFSHEEAARINHEILENIFAAANLSSPVMDFTIMSRSDSTLRGHYPLETDLIREAMEQNRSQSPPTLIIPFFDAGGRYTIDDIHYVAEGDLLIPAAQTPFAKDASFGYKNSHLPSWVEEKTLGRTRAEHVKSISLRDIRSTSLEDVLAKLLRLSDHDVCIVNAAAPRDLEVVAWACSQAEMQGRSFIYRVAASFVTAKMGLAKKELWRPSSSVHERNGGLVIVGSYVPKTTEQLAFLCQHSSIKCVELSVSDLLEPLVRSQIIREAVMLVEKALLEGDDVVVSTSRTVVTGCDGVSSLAIGHEISKALVTLLSLIQVKPRFLIAKGGITSSDLATHALGVKRATVLGQILPGVPVWKLGNETKFPDLPYIIFPGNVGNRSSLYQAIESLQPNDAS